MCLRRICFFSYIDSLFHHHRKNETKICTKESNTDLIFKSKEIRLFVMKLAPMVMMEFEEFHRRNFHHHLYYPLNRNKLNSVLEENHQINSLFLSVFLLRLNGELVQSYERDERISKSDS